MAQINLKNALTQQLQSLHGFGIGQMLTANDGLKFDFADAVGVEPVPPAATEPAVQHDLTATATLPSTQTSSSKDNPTEDPPNPAPPDPDIPSVDTPAAAHQQANPVEIEPAPVPEVKAPPVPALVTSPAALPAETSEAAPQSRQEREQQLSVIRAEVADCVACPELCQSRSRTVFGVGNPETKVVFLGEGPGANEDRLGEPFVGEAGKLLNKILTASQLPREQVYILNTVKCRPPNNRNPLPLELENCRGFLDRQLDVIRPEFIVCLGSVAAKSLLATQASLGKLRKQFHQYRESKVLVTYHPAYLLRTPSAKKHVWEDMKMLMRELGVEL